MFSLYVDIWIYVWKFYVHICVYGINCPLFIIHLYVKLLHLFLDMVALGCFPTTRSLSQEIHDELMATELADAQHPDMELMTLGVVG